jgi:hypothetical protein
MNPDTLNPQALDYGTYYAPVIPNPPRHLAPTQASDLPLHLADPIFPEDMKFPFRVLAGGPLAGGPLAGGPLAGGPLASVPCFWSQEKFFEGKNPWTSILDRPATGSGQSSPIRWTLSTGKKRLARPQEIVWELHNGPVPKGSSLEHVNGLLTDNRIENLRLRP